MVAPSHIAIIMDGNRRWARARGLSLAAGYEAGMNNALLVIESCIGAEIEHLTLYALSAENFSSRPRIELDVIFAVLKDRLERYMQQLNALSVRVAFVGDTEQLPDYVQGAIRRIVDATAQNGRINLRVALNYGGRQEITRAAQRLARLASEGVISVGDIDSGMLAEHLYDAGAPDPDMILRTGCVDRMRVSNFMLWQMAYSELFFSRTLWPDYSASELRRTVDEFGRRTRSFGS